MGHALPAFDADGIYGAVLSLSRCDGIGGRITVNRVTYVPGKCTLLTLAYGKTVADLKPQVVVVMIGPLLVFDHVVGGRRLRVGTPAFESYIDAHLDKLRSILGSGGPTKLVLTTVPCMIP